MNRFKPILTSVFKPYGLHRPREQRLFEGEKILVLRKTKNMCCTYVDFPCYVSRTYMILKPTHINLKYLTGLLNSKLINFWIYHKGKRQGEQLQVDKAPLQSIPIYIPEEKNKIIVLKELIKTVESIIELIRNMKNNKNFEKGALSKDMELLKEMADKLIFDSSTILMILRDSQSKNGF